MSSDPRRAALPAAGHRLQKINISGTPPPDRRDGRVALRFAEYHRPNRWVKPDLCRTRDRMRMGNARLCHDGPDGVKPNYFAYPAGSQIRAYAVARVPVDGRIGGV